MVAELGIWFRQIRHERMKSACSFNIFNSTGGTASNDKIAANSAGGQGLY